MQVHDFKKSQAFLQNVWKNRLLTKIILENKKEFNILFIQKPPWFFIWNIPSSSNKEDNIIVSASNHPA